MLKISKIFLVIPLAATIFLSGCTSPNFPQNTSMNFNSQNQITEITNPAGVIFPKEFFPNQKTFSGDAWKFVNGYFTPTVENAKKADEIVYKCITDQEKFIDNKTKLYNYSEDQLKSEKEYYIDLLNNIESRYSQYHRQYVGYTGKNGHKLVWINFFTMSDAFLPRWKKDIVLPPLPYTSEGTKNYYFFNVLVDLEDESCINFAL